MEAHRRDLPDCGGVSLLQFLVVIPGRVSRAALAVLELARRKGRMPDQCISPLFDAAMALDT